jgi:hypothetical protein
VGQLIFTPENSTGGSVVATTTFSSSNTSVATVSTAGAVCAGTWDATFVTCNVNLDPVTHNPISGTATITATAAGIASSGVTVSVHPRVSSVVISGSITGCTSTGFTNQLDTSIVHVCSTQATPHDAGAPCGPLAKDITSIAGTISYQTTDSTVVTIDTNNLATAHNPGIAGIFANIAGVSSATTVFRTCMPKLLVLHLSTDPIGTNTISANMTAAQSLVLRADMTDENNVGIGPAPVTIVSNNPTVAGVSATTLSAVAAGGAGIVASCAPPVCGNALNTPIYSNLFSVSVAGSSPASTVYAATSFAPSPGTNATAIPIDTGTNAAGTAITLAGPPNSLVFAASGVRAFLGTSGIVATLDPTTNTETTVATGVIGKVIAVNPAGTIALISNAAIDPATGSPFETVAANQRLFVFNQAANSLQTLVVPGAVSGSFTSDGFRAYIASNSGKIFVYSPFASLLTLGPFGTPTSTAPLASNNFVYATGSLSLTSLAVCSDLSAISPPATSTPQLVASTNNADQIVAVNSTGIDIATATVTSPTSGICPPGISYTNQFIDFGQGAFTARQVLVASNGSRVVVIPAGINKIFTAVPGTPGATIITLPAGATEALAGGLTNDGNTLWVGVAGTNTVDKIDLTTGTDVVQVPTHFLKADGSTPAPPNIFALRPK